MSCSICNGVKFTREVQKNDWGVEILYMKPCVCALIERFHARVGNEIFHAMTLSSSPLRSKMTSDLFIEANRLDLLPHLKHVFWYAGMDYFFRMVTDSELMDAWLSKGKESSSDFQGYSSLRDAVEDPSLLIIFIGVMTYPNRALPGVFLEALKLRNHKGLPTWIVSARDNTFTQGHLCWSAEGQVYIDRSFERIRIIHDSTTQVQAARTTVVSKTKEGDHEEVSNAAPTKTARLSNYM